MRIPLARKLILTLSGAASVVAVAAAAPRMPATPLGAESTASLDQQVVPDQARFGVLTESGVHNFYFTRAVFSGRRAWSTDYPQADWWIASVLSRLTLIDVAQSENAVRLDDPALRHFPFVYAVEVGRMRLRGEEVEGLRNYLLAGGFLAVDDFWGEYEWQSFEREMARVLPEHEIVEVPLDHEIFRTFYEIDQIIQVPVVGRGVSGGPTHEKGGITPHFRGIFDDSGRLMVAINYNTDLGDAWEWAEEPLYPLTYSTYAYQVGANMMIYAMTR
ncbi:MAG: DUF4159 domain-containing protein [Gemmatimonadota bacterium]